jgi:hypothetical protein
VTKLLYEEMKKERVRICEVLRAVIAVAPSPSWMTFSLLVSQPGEKSELANFTLTKEAS